MSEERQSPPFQSLGRRLKTIRQKLHESVADVSGAVEIDENTLQRIELGSERPTEDILMLLINHFGMREDEAASLWQLAGYDRPHQHETDEDMNGKAAVFLMTVDPRIIYTDGIQITANKNGVVMTFSQSSGTPNPLATARVGMSREQAYNVLRILQQTLQHSEPRQLPTSTDQDQ
ncbi:MAG TPA: helix-turn-helix domain-containing protein [Candidatus Saccharimonadales bacterium]|jgi:transcriptional regulator with XRE-family HTH domain|nr:helix-turn-helix domain-containing protein [Candidatus Saccharimonadales bacterium]